jgi:predicted GIY-YIG superfamily endonuclease
MAYYVYMLASCPRGTLYIGVTGDLVVGLDQRTHL